ncbi:MAG: FG-GAP repeat protein, partial [Phycisphaerae bacterium]|nr:FG-GAP repeat protein [Phycisphaerae bacterium]
FDADLILLNRPSPELLIDQDGRVIEAVNITVNNGLGQDLVNPLIGTTVSVDDISNAADPASATFSANVVGDKDGESAPEGEISGEDGTFRARTTYDAITITNLSNKDLVINDIDPANPNASPTVEFDAEDVSIEFDIAHDVGPTDIDIQNDSVADIRIDGIIENPIGSTSLFTEGGSILNTAGGIIRTNVLDLAAPGGAIGTGTDRLNVDLVLSEGRPTGLSAEADQDIFLNLTGRLREAGVTAPIFNSDTISAGGDIDLLLQTGLEDTGAAGTASGITVNVVKELHTAEYFRYFRPDTGLGYPLDPRFYADLAQAAEIGSTYDFGHLIAGRDLTINAAQSDAADTPVGLRGNTDILGTGLIDVLTNGDIDLTETAGDMRINDITSTAGNITLVAAQGDMRIGLVNAMAGDVTMDALGVGSDIFDTAFGNDAIAYVKGNSITMSVPGGGIGASDNVLEIDSSQQATGAVTAFALNSVFITETDGDLNLASAASVMEDVALTTLNGAILEAGDDVEADIQGRFIDLITTGGGVGAIANDLEIYGAGTGQEYNNLQLDPRAPDPGRLFVDAEADVYLATVNAAVNVLKVASDTGEVRITVQDTVRVAPNSSEDLYLDAAGGSSLFGEAVASGIITAPGPVSLFVGDDVYVPVGTLIESDTSVLVFGDFKDPDPDPTNGTTIDILGDIQAPAVEIRGGDNLDFIQLRNPNGVNAGGSTILTGNNGDDRFFIQGVGTEMTVNAGDGADRIYVSSNAARDLFTGGGFYDDTAIDPFSVLNGTLENIVGNLFINPDAKGPGGTPDGLFVSAGGETDSLSGELVAGTLVDPFTSAVPTGAVTGLNMPGSIHFNVGTGEDLVVLTKLGSNDDTFQIKEVADNLVAYVYGGDGDDTLNVGNDDDRVTDISGIAAFFGESGTDTLNVFDTGADAGNTGQLSAISVTGLGMGTNSLGTYHNDVFGAGYNIGDPPYPATIYFASRDMVTDQYASTVEDVHVYLGDFDDTFAVDSTYDLGTTTIHGGGGDDTITVGSTETGLYPASLRHADFISGPLFIDGEDGPDTITVTDSGDSNPNVGMYQGDTVSGLGMTGSVTFASADTIDVRLGVADDTFYVPGTSAELTTTVWMGGGFDTVYVGTVEGQENAGFLDNFQGTFVIEGEGPETGDTIYFNDYDSVAGQTFVIDNSTGFAEDTPSASLIADLNAETLSAEITALFSANGFELAPASVVTVTTADEAWEINDGDERFVLQLIDDAGTSRLEVVSAATLTGGDPWPIDTTTVSRSGAESIVYRRAETVVINAGQGDDTINLHSTHREQDVLGGHSSTFTINAGLGDDTVNVGTPEGSGFILDSFAIDLDPPTFDSTKGIPVMVNGQGGFDTVHYNDSASTADTDLAFVENSFTDLFPANPPTDPPTPSQFWVDQFTEIFGEDPQGTSYATVALSRTGELAPLNINARLAENIAASLGSGEDVVQLTTGTYDYDITVYGGAGRDTFNVENGVDMAGHTATFNGMTGDDLVYVDFATPTVADPGALGNTLDGISLENTAGEKATTAPEAGPLAAGQYFLETRDNAGQWQFRLVDALGAAVHVADLTAPTQMIDDWQNISDVPDAGSGPEFDTLRGFFLRFGDVPGDYAEGSLAGGTAADILAGVPESAISLVFNGGPQDGSHDGDKLRIAGDGVTPGGTYTPSSTTAHAGTVALRGNTFDFSGVEPLVVHGLPDFATVTSDDPADLVVDSINVADLNLSNLTLHVVTVDGVISWTQQPEFILEEASEPQHVGSAIAISGDTMVAGAQLVSEEYGAVFVYQWNYTDNNWVETAKLYPSDRGIAGEGFGQAVSIHGNTLVIGAPDDATFDTDSGAVYVFERQSNGDWLEKAKLTASDASSYDEFGQSVSVDGSTILVGAPGGSNDDAYFFTRSGTNWIEQLKLHSTYDYGRSVAVDGNTAVIGRPDRYGYGTAHVYTYNGSVWSHRKELTPSDPDSGERFGEDVAIDGGKIVVGAPNWDNPEDSSNEAHGRAFIFEGSGSNWTRTARLTAEGGLPQSESPTEINDGAHFGTSVDVDGRYVVVGAPDFDNGLVLDAGAAYVFYQYTDYSATTGNSWTRSSGPDGPGRLDLGAAGAGATVGNPNSWADQFGYSVAVDGSRIVAGIPGFNDTDQFNDIEREDVGGVRTYTTGGSIPAATLANLRAEFLSVADSTNLSSKFGAETIYDQASRTLLVSDPGLNKVYSFINEGLHWRLSQTLTGSSGYEFGADIDTDGNRLVIGAPGGERAYIYNRSGETWTYSTYLYQSGTSDFGRSVAVDGNRIVVGAPDTTTRYYSDYQPLSGHKIQLTQSGVVYAYNYNGSYWAVEDLLMPYASDLWYDTSYWNTYTPSDYNKVKLWRDGSWHTYGIGGHYVHEENSTSNALKLAPYMMVGMVDYNGGDRGWVYRSNWSSSWVTKSIPDWISDDIDYMIVGTTKSAYAYLNIGTYGTGYHYVNEGNNTYFAVGGHSIGMAVDYTGGDDGFKSAWTYGSGTYRSDLPGWMNDDVDVVMVGSTTSNTKTEALPRYYSYLNYADWGESVDIVGSRVYVGAPGAGEQNQRDDGRIAVYDLNDSKQYHWNFQAGSTQSSWYAPLLPTDYENGVYGNDDYLGSQVTAASSTRVYAGAPENGGGAVNSYYRSGDYLSLSKTITLPMPSSNGDFGDLHTIGVTANRMLMGAPDQYGYSGAAYLYDSSGNYLGPQLRPFILDDNQYSPTFG